MGVHKRGERRASLKGKGYLNNLKSGMIRGRIDSVLLLEEPRLIQGQTG